MNLSTIISFLIAPFIALVLIIMASRLLDKKSLAQFVSSYFLGILTVIPMIIGLYLASEYSLIETSRSLRRYLLFSFVIVGFLVELTKFILLRYYFIPKEGVSKPFDGILYSVMIAMGFATAANVYFYMVLPAPFNTPTVNLTLPLANLIIGTILGFFVGFGKFRKNRIDYLTGLGVATFFQGFYIFGILANDFLLISLVGTVTLIIAVLLSLRSLNTDVEQMM
jgi:RsiW-degrading membrane proteinase PrsW (M82 family)